MPKKRSTDPKTLAVLGVATVAALALATRQVMTALNPPPRPTTVAMAPGAGTPGASPAVTGGMAAPGVLPGGPPAPGTAALPPTNLRPPEGGESALAPAANPFAPIPGGDTTKPPVGAGALTGSGAGAPVPPPPVTPLPFVRIDPYRELARPLPGGTAPPAVGAPPAPPAEPDPGPRPELVGTLLGERPSGVFMVEKQVTVVPVGQKVGNWEVVSVDHGSAVLKAGKRVVKVLVGGPSAKDGVVAAADTARPVVAGSPTRAPGAVETGAPRSDGAALAPDAAPKPAGAPGAAPGRQTPPPAAHPTPPKRNEDEDPPEPIVGQQPAPAPLGRGRLASLAEWVGSVVAGVWDGVRRDLEAGRVRQMLALFRLVPAVRYDLRAPEALAAAAAAEAAPPAPEATLVRRERRRPLSILDSR